MTTNKWIPERTVVLADDVVLGTSYGDLTGLEWAVKAGQTYKFKAVVVYDADAATDGVSFSVDGPASPTSLGFIVTYGIGAATPVQTFCNAYDEPAAAGASSALTSDNVATIEGTITPSASGFVTVRGIAEGANKITALSGVSYLTWSRIDWPSSL